MSLLNQLREDLNPHAAGNILADEKLSFNVTKAPTLANSYREQLKLMAISIDVNINALLGMLNTEQIAQVVENHQEVLWEHPEDESATQCLLSGITKELKVWWLEFNEAANGVPAGSYQLHDCKIEDVIGLMETIEKIIEPKQLQNTIKS